MTSKIIKYMHQLILEILVLFLQLLVNRSKRKRRRRADKPLTGSEKVKIINMRTGKKVRHSNILKPYT